MIKGVIFDMDGVLVNNSHIHIEAFDIFCRKHGIEQNQKRLTEMFGMGNDEIIPALLPAEIVEKYGIDALAEEKEQIYRDIFAERIAPMPGLVDFLKELKTNGIKCAVGSSGPAKNVIFVLEKCGIRDMFDAIANGDMVTHAKPDPAIFNLAAKLIDLPTSECLVIEDSFAGIEAAHKAGCKVIGVTTSYSAEELSKVETEMLIPDFNDLNYSIIATI